MFHRRIHRRAHASDELNITAFMNVLVVLVSFLLATAVFSHVARLEMHLPGAGAPSAGDNVPAQPELQLEITIRTGHLVVGDRSRGVMNEIAKKNGVHDYRALTDYLGKVKAQFPQVVEATVLAMEATSYDEVIQVMDAVRMDVREDKGQWLRTELFTQVALGSAVVSATEAANQTASELQP